MKTREEKIDALVDQIQDFVKERKEELIDIDDENNSFASYVREFDKNNELDLCECDYEIGNAIQMVKIALKQIGKKFDLNAELASLSKVYLSHNYMTSVKNSINHYQLPEAYQIDLSSELISLLNEFEGDKIALHEIKNRVESHARLNLAERTISIDLNDYSMHLVIDEDMLRSRIEDLLNEAGMITKTMINNAGNNMGRSIYCDECGETWEDAHIVHEWSEYHIANFVRIGEAPDGGENHILNVVCCPECDGYK